MLLLFGFLTTEQMFTDQAEKAGAGQPEVPSSMAIDVKVLSGQVTVRIQDLQGPLKRLFI